MASNTHTDRHIETQINSSFNLLTGAIELATPCHCNSHGHIVSMQFNSLSFLGHLSQLCVINLCTCVFFFLLSFRLSCDRNSFTSWHNKVNYYWDERRKKRCNKKKKKKKKNSFLHLLQQKIFRRRNCFTHFYFYF